ncbi:MAG: hypothetical protein KC431_25170, partial [Myxococcales bacterium]|nr:hypothetical protein [Myxococcales bacterium]
MTIKLRVIPPAAASLLALALALPASSVRAGGTETHDGSGFDDFDSGQADGAAIEASGKLTRGY